MAVFRCRHALGTTVYHKHAPERMPMVITGVTFGASGGYVYACSWPDGDTTSHFECELVTEWTGYLPEAEAADDDECEDAA